MSVIPFLWTSHAQRDLAATSRRPVPLRELSELQDRFARTLRDVPDGTLIQVRVTNSDQEPGDNDRANTSGR